MKLTEADQKFLDAHIAPRINEENYFVSNPFTGEEIPTTPQIATLVSMIQELSYNDFSLWTLKKWDCTEKNCISKFDRARHIVLKLDSEIYSKIID